MVAFGQRLKTIAESNPRFTSYYLDYKSLKNALNLISDATEDAHTENLPDCNPACLTALESEGSAELADAEERFMLAIEGEFAKVGVLVCVHVCQREKILRERVCAYV